jgi:DNA-binding IclR family transcriptional regulator
MERDLVNATPDSAVRGVPHDPARPAQVKSADRILDIIELLANERAGLGFGELARLRHIPKSSLHALLGVLTARGYVELDASKRVYTLGIRTWEMGQAYLAHRDLVAKSVPHMEAVVRAINETVQLAVLDGIENVYLAKVDCSHPVRLQSEVGRRLYAHATGLGKVLLAELPPPELHARLEGVELAMVSPRTIRQVDQLKPVLERARQRGYALDDEEYTAGLRCVAVPILGSDGVTVAALSASIPISRAGSAEMVSALRHIAMASIDISKDLGVSHPDQRLAALTEWRGDVLAEDSTAERRVALGLTGMG